MPDWHQAVDCSAWDNMCTAARVSEGRYEPYPFPLGKHVKELDRFHPVMMSLSDVPGEWHEALHVDNGIDGPPPRTVQYIYPPEAAASDASRCLAEAMELAWQVQLDALLGSGRIQRETTTNMIAFTISDYNYAFDSTSPDRAYLRPLSLRLTKNFFFETVMHDVFEMTSDVVGFGGSFFMVALDKETVEMACRYGYPVVAWPSARPDDATQLKHAVANTKFEASLHLTSRGVDFLFYEMDVWFLTSPVPLIADYHGNEERDVLLSSHAKDPLAVNIGVYSVSANERTKEFFELCVSLARESPGTHDQWIVSQLLLLAWTITAMGAPGIRFTRMWKPPPKRTPTMNHPPRYGSYNTMEILAGERPYPTKNTIAIHTLCSSPLKKPFGKKIMAKELGAWTGFRGPDGRGGYYARTGERRRYLWMDGHDSPNAYNTLQSFEWDAMNQESMVVNNAAAFKWTIAVLLALARRTGRIFVMPKVIAEEGAHFLWTLLDFEPVEAMDIDYRETNFPHNSKTTPLQSAARTALAPLREVDKEGTMYVEYPAGASAVTKAWTFDNTTSDGTALDAWWALHTAIPEVDSAELLLVNPHFMSAPYALNLVSKMRSNDYQPSVAEKEIMDVYAKLRWCLGDPIVDKESVIGRSSAELSCHGKGRR